MTQFKKRFGLSIPKTLYEKLKDEAEYQGKTLNALCLEIFWEYFEESKKDENTQFHKEDEK